MISSLQSLLNDSLKQTDQLHFKMQYQMVLSVREEQLQFISSFTLLSNIFRIMQVFLNKAIAYKL